MDLSIKLEDTRLYIRVAGLVKTPKGYLFEERKGQYIFPIGGKIKLGETSKEAAIREIIEEIGFVTKELKSRGAIENHYTNMSDGEKVQEICFVYEVEEEFTGQVPGEFVEIQIQDIDKHVVKPLPIVEILKDGTKSFKHIIIK